MSLSDYPHQVLLQIYVVHGATEIVENPICAFGRKNLDFGQGFYVTDIKEQAVKWATLTAQKRKGECIINRYLLEKDTLMSEARCKVFKAYDAEWLNFIVASRKGLNPSANYDYIEGGIANDRVIDTVNLYISGLMSSDVALNRLAMKVLFICFLLYPQIGIPEALGGCMS